MSFLQRNRGAISALAATAFVVVLIGCGGGGGGGGFTGSTSVTNGTNADGGNNGTNTNATNGTNTTSGNNGTNTTSGSNGSVLPSNKIIYGSANGNQVTVSAINADGSGNQTLATFSNQFVGVIPHPTVANQFLFGYTNNPGDTQKFGIFRNGTVATAGATRLTSDRWDAVGTIQVTPDGSKIIFTATEISGQTVDNGLWLMSSTGANLVRLDSADYAALSPDGTKVVYSKFDGVDGDIWTLTLADPANTKVQVTNDSKDQIMPQFSKDGTKIVYASSEAGDFDVWVMQANGSGQTRLTTAAEPEFGPSMNSAGTQVAYTLFSSDISKTGLYKVDADGTDAASIKLLPSIFQEVFWAPTTAVAAAPERPGRNLPSGLTYGIGRNLKRVPSDSE